MALNGAEPVTPSVLTRFVDRFADYGFPAQSLTPVYGLAEAALAVTFSDFSRPFSVARFDPKRLFEGRAETSEYGRALVSVGRPLPGYAVEIRDGAGGVCSDGTVGTVFVHGPSVMKEYYGNPAATAAAIADGWLDTGDTGFVLDGELYVYGRAKDLVIVRGEELRAADDRAGAGRPRGNAQGLLRRGGVRPRRRRGRRRRTADRLRRTRQGRRRRRRRVRSPTKRVGG